MGVLFESKQLRKREVPPDTGECQKEALQAIYKKLEEINRAGFSFAVAFQGFGSSTTDRAGSRGDVDGVLFFARVKDGEYVRSVGEEEVMVQHLFRESLKQMVSKTAEAYGVKAEFHIISLLDAMEGMCPKLKKDLLFVDHMATSPKEWRIDGPLTGLDRDGNPYKPLDKIFSYGIDIHEELEDWEVAKVSSTVYRYMTLKASYFAASYQQVGEEMDLKALQRALEFSKAGARKMMSFVAATDPSYNSREKSDVTDKEDMYSQFQRLAQRIDPDEKLGIWRYCSYLIDMNADYDEVVKEVLASGDIEHYESWLSHNGGAAFEAAYRLAAGCWKHIDDTLWVRSDIPIEDMHDFDNLYRLPAIDDPVEAIRDPSYE